MVKVPIYYFQVSYIRVKSANLNNQLDYPWMHIYPKVLVPILSAHPCLYVYSNMVCTGGM